MCAASHTTYSLERDCRDRRQLSVNSMKAFGAMSFMTENAVLEDEGSKHLFIYLLVVSGSLN